MMAQPSVRFLKEYQTPGVLNMLLEAHHSVGPEPPEAEVQMISETKTGKVKRFPGAW
jgi:hypothetical protein